MSSKDPIDVVVTRQPALAAPVNSSRLGRLFIRPAARDIRPCMLRARTAATRGVPRIDASPPVRFTCRTRR